MRKLKPSITKPYRVPLRVDNRQLLHRSVTTDARILLPGKPLYAGDIRSELNPFSIRCIGITEFQTMKLIRSEWPDGEVLEIESV